MARAGEAMGSTNFIDLPEPPEEVQTMAAMLARNMAHLASLLKASQYPGEKQLKRLRGRRC